MRRILPYLGVLTALWLLAQTAWAQTPLTVKVKGGKENAFLLYAKEKLQKVEWKKVQDGSTTEKAYELTETVHTPQGTFKAASIFLEGESSTEYIVTLPESKDGYQNTFYGLRCTNPITIQSWGPTAWTSLDEAFAGAEVTIDATNSPKFITKSLRRMFAGSTLNSATLASWNVSGIEDFEGMFEDCQKLDVSLAKWDVRSARNMRRMFAGATAFSQSLATWGAKVQNVGNMEGMFAGAVAYNESLAHWQLSSCETLGIGGSGISAANYAASLKGWVANPSIAKNITLDASGLCYAEAASEHEKLAKEKQWHFVGDYCLFLI